MEKVTHQEMNCRRVCSRCSSAHWNTEPKWSLEPSSLRSAQVTEIPKSILCVAHVSHTHLWSPEDSLGCESVFEVGSRVHCCIHLCTLLATPHTSPQEPRRFRRSELGSSRLCGRLFTQSHLPSSLNSNRGGGDDPMRKGLPMQA